MNKLITIVLLLLSSSVSFAQFKGRITDKRDRPKKNIWIYKKDTSESVVSDKTGKFVFQTVNPNDTLIMNVSKKAVAVIPVGNMNNIVIVLDKKHIIISNGNINYSKDYETVNNKTFASNIITREQIERMSANSIYDIFRNGIPGVIVTEDAQGYLVLIRGGSSIESGNEVLFIIDGMSYESSAEVDAQLSINDIEKIEVLKEGTGYGVKGANGVIIITTIPER